MTTTDDVYVVTYWAAPGPRGQRYRVQTYTGKVLKAGFRTRDDAERFIASRSSRSTRRRSRVAASQNKP